MAETVLISVDKSRPVLTISRHKNARSGATIAGLVPLPFKGDKLRGRRRREAAHHDEGAGSRMMARGAYNHLGRSED